MADATETPAEGPDRLAVDGRAEVFELVEAGFLRPPVVPVTPVLDQVADVTRRYAVLPARTFDLVREASDVEPATQIVEDGVVDVDLEAFDVSR